MVTVVMGMVEATAAEMVEEGAMVAAEIDVADRTADMERGGVAMGRAEACHRYRGFLEGFSLSGLDCLDDLARPDIHFRDPLNDTHDVGGMKRVFARRFDEVDDPRFIITHQAADGDTCFFRWHFTCRPRRSGRGHPWIIDGVSEVRFAADGRAVEHIDYWDAGHYVYERIPLFGYLIRYLRKRLATALG
jgi:steroid delta-isomerase